MMDFVTPNMNILRFNSFARKGQQFVDAMNDYRLLRTLPSNFMEKVLDKLHIRDGYVMDVLEYGDSYGRKCRFYAHKAATKGIYKGVLDYVEAYKKDRSLFSSIFSDEARMLDDYPIEEYSDDMEIYGYLSREAEKKIPDVQEYLSYPFTKEAVWQLYLLDIADTILPLFWHGGYHKRTFFFDRRSFLTFDHKEVASFVHSKDIIPKVEITGENTAIVKCCFWSEWHGLCVEEVIAERSDGKVTFSRDQSRLKILFPHNSSLRF